MPEQMLPKVMLCNGLKTDAGQIPFCPGDWWLPLTQLLAHTHAHTHTHKCDCVLLSTFIVEILTSLAVLEFTNIYQSYWIIGLAWLKEWSTILSWVHVTLFHTHAHPYSWSIATTRLASDWDTIPPGTVCGSSSAHPLPTDISHCAKLA